MRGENEPVIERQPWLEENIRFRNVCLIYSLVAIRTVCSFKKCCQTLLVKEENSWPVKVLFLGLIATMRQMIQTLLVNKET